MSSTVSALAQIAQLTERGRIEEAAELATRERLYLEAAKLWEMACRFELAAEALLSAGEATRAFLLAARLGGHAIEARGIAALSSKPDEARTAIERVQALGHPAAGARLALAIGEAAQAADLFESAGMWSEAAHAYRRAADLLSEARCLGRLLRDTPELSEARLRLGEILLAQRQMAAGIGMLQQIPQSDALRRRALPLLRRAFRELGLVEAEREAKSELAAFGERVESEANDAARVEPSAGVLFGRYRVLSTVATTATARLYHAEDLLTHEQVAVKIFSAATLRDTGRDALRRFRQEAEILQQLRHPGIVPLLGYEPSAPASILGWMPGGSLADLLSRGSVSPARAAKIVTELLAALHEAHRRGILHRDIKPSNILFDASGQATLSDFGVAHISDAAKTVTTGLIGTLSYMAPEQRQGEAASISSDIYSVGAIFWEMLSGAPPFAQQSFLSELSIEQRELAERLIGKKLERPTSALEAEQLVARLAWPDEVPASRARAAAEVSSSDATLERLEALDDGSYQDRLLERRIVLLPCEAELLERAQAVSQTPAGAAILRCHAEEHTLWIEAGADELLRELTLGRT